MSEIENEGVPKYLYGVVINNTKVEVERIAIESETSKTIRVRHGGRTFAGQTVINKRINRQSIHRTPQDALARFVQDVRGAIEREEARLIKFRSQLAQATELAESENPE